MEIVVLDNEEVMECIRGDLVIHVCNSKDFKGASKKIMQGKNTVTTIYCQLLKAKVKIQIWH